MQYPRFHSHSNLEVECHNGSAAVLELSRLFESCAYRDTGGGCGGRFEYCTDIQGSLEMFSFSPASALTERA